MSTYSQILYQIVFTTRNRKNSLTQPNRDKLCRIIWAILEKKKCHPYAINGTSNHLHIATHINPSIALSNLVKDIKMGTSEIIKNEKLFPLFESWQEGYGAFTYSIDAKKNLVNYILNQEEHHRKIDLETEYKMLLDEFDIQYNEKYLF